MDQNSIDFNALFRKALKYWYIFAVFLIAALAANFYLLRQTHPVYRASARLLIKDDENSGQLSQESLFEDLGLGSADKNLENEMMLLNSTPMMLKVVNNLGLQYQYFRVERFLNRDLYDRAPITIAQWNPVDPAFGLEAVVTINQQGDYSLAMTYREEERTFEGEFGRPLQLPHGDLTLTRSTQEPGNFPIAIRITHPWQRAKELRNALEIILVGDESSILQLSFQDYSRERASDILEEVIDVYNTRSIDTRNEVFRNTIDLINERIRLINSELTEAEVDVETYKSQNSMVELSSEGSMLMEELSEYNRDITEADIQLTILQSIEDFLIENQEDFEFVPTNATLNNLTLTSQLDRFNQLLAEKESMLNNLGPEHPDLKLVIKQLDNFRETIIDNIQSIKRDLQVTRTSTQELKNNLQNRIQSLPKRERELVEIERRKTVKENLYLYLLEKREESAISMAVTMAKGEIVEPAEGQWSPVKPNKPRSWLIAAFLGLAVPTGIVFLILQFHDKVETEHDLEHLSELTLAGVVARSPKKAGSVVIKENSRSAAAEMFRMLRANLSYILPRGKSQSLLITSTLSGEGKSFITLNLGLALALSGKKVVLFHTDLRKPNQGVRVDGKKDPNQLGLVNYIIEPSLQWSDIVQRGHLHPNLDVIGSGPKPPNPGELVMSDRLRELVAELRKHYDYILFDTAPVGVVADTLQMKDLADATMLVVRANYTPRGQIKFLNGLAEQNKLPKPFLVLNSVLLSDYRYGKYGYGYSYTRSNGYFEEVN